MMSIDYSKLEVVSQFSSLLELLGNPEKLAKILADTKSAIEESKALLGPLKTKEKADAYLAEIELSIDKADEQVKQKLEDAEVQCAGVRADAQRDREAVAVELEEVRSTKTETKKLNKEVKDKLEGLLTKEAELVAATQEAAQNAAYYKQLSDVLQEKLDKLASVMGA